MNNKKIVYKNNEKIIHINKEKYILKEKNKELKKIYNYLDNKNFINYLPLLNEYNEEYNLYPYIEEYIVSPEEKAKYLINLMIKLHNKTIINKEINIEEKYNEILEEIDSTYKYYLELQDHIETNQYMSPAEYLLIRNISSIYSLLNYSRNKLELWYEISKEANVRQVFLNGNISLNNYIYANKEYLKDWTMSKKGLVIYDFINFYQKEFMKLNMIELFNHYQEKFKYNEQELNLFLSIISIPKKINFNNNNYINTLNIREILLYTKKTHEFILYENKEKQETDEKEFKQEDNSI